MAAPGQTLRGLVGQGMDGRKKKFSTAAFCYPAGSFTWICPVSGWWLFTNWGSGGNSGGGSPGASGAFTQTLVYLARGEPVAIFNGNPSSGLSSTFTFPTGRIVAAGAAISNTPGGASGGDINIDGSPGGSGSPTSDGKGGNGGIAGLGATGGAGSPGRRGYRGSNGGTGGPGCGSSNGALAGLGFAIIVRQDSSVLL